MSTKAFRLLAICTLIAVIAAAWAIRRDWARWSADEHGTKLFPELAANIDDVARIRIRHRNTEMTLERRPDGWVLVQSDGFPARGKSIQELLFALSEARKLEPKTQDDRKYAKLQVGDPAKPEAQSKSIEVLHKNGRSLAALILGKENLLLQAIGDGGAYLRLPGQKQVWLVTGNLVAGTDVQDWLENPVIDIPRQRFDRAKLVHPNGDTLIVTQSPERKGTFLLDGLAASDKLISDYYPSDIARALEQFEIHGARRRSKVNFPADATIKGEFSTLDGLTVTFDLATIDGKDWIRFTSATTRNQQSPEAVAEAKTIAARTKDWVFLIPEFESIHLKKGRAQVVAKAKS